MDLVTVSEVLLPRSHVPPGKQLALHSFPGVALDSFADPAHDHEPTGVIGGPDIYLLPSPAEEQVPSRAI